MQEHRFALGQSVCSSGTMLTSLYGAPTTLMPAGVYSIVRHMPPREGKLQYRIRCAKDGHERVVVEDDITS